MSINKIKVMELVMGRLPTDEIEELIIKSVRESSLFRNEWERLFISTVFQMFMEKGDFVHFVDTYPFDRIDYEWYFRDRKSVV